ncbi:sugar ABC transporter ATP-binding protein [Actinomadura darangshiensis]|uniref:Sugar ABC transporter ATP-binding protein n=1 Tax=Actinomadura darangshiensis TaxID=705336 RepID=A0A4R5BGE6_9ACTN|nr:sugar ABC transporter ATP-binding protein [Actinomadura darangshiensis]TDD85461.1 sugar ABC transporter ATP-binding protein [Actinomadura darangshiensis]
MDVALQGIRKSYGGTAVLHEVSLTLRGGRVHGIVGENGAGKSTLARIMCGAVAADSGQVAVDGEPAAIRSPRDALRRGIALVTQEGAIVPGLSVADNVFLGGGVSLGDRRGRRVRGLRDPAGDRRRFGRLAARTGFSLDPAARAGDLPLVHRQQVEILRALAQGARLIALDEPTALLPAPAAERLLRLARDLAERDGIAIVLISHRLDEVLSACDSVTVLRDGRHVTTAPAAELTPQALLRAMVGRPVETLYPEPAPVPDDAPVVLAVRGLSRGRAVRDVRLEVRAGEIVGLAGLVGSGRSETLRLVFGADRPDAGEVTILGRPATGGSPAHAMGLGAALVPESRGEQGLVLVRSAAENLAMASLPRRRRLGFVRRGAERRAVRAVAEPLGITGPHRPAWTLSGGSQQRSVFGKWLVRSPRLLLVDEPTRGVDVAAKAQIHRLIADLAARGVAVLLASSEVEEVLGLAHRVLVMRDGRIAGEFPRGASAEDVLTRAGLR